MKVAYYRVSTKDQGESGLGLEAQRISVLKTFGTPDLEFIEIETGTRKKKRPILKQAIDKVKESGGVLWIAKVDRLARNVHFVSALQEAQIDFRCADMPSANKTMIQIMAAMAEMEADLISKRTKEALARSTKQKGIPEYSNGRHRSEILAENRSKIVRWKPTSEQIEKFLKLRQMLSFEDIEPLSGTIFGKHMRAHTLRRIEKKYKYNDTI